MAAAIAGVAILAVAGCRTAPTTGASAAASAPSPVSTNQASALKLPPVISDSMVLQQRQRVPIWGWAAPGESVTVRVGRQKRVAVAGADGKWMVRLSPLKAGGPLELRVTGQGSEIVVTNVLVGEVWVGSGQSNMDMPVTSYTNGDAVLAGAVEAGPYPQLRLLRSPGGRWMTATPQNIGGTSALLFSFGLPLQKALGVPVGLMVGAVGGTPSGFWLSEAAYAADSACSNAIAAFAPTYSFDDAQKQYQQALAAWETNAATAKEQGKLAPRKPDLPQKPGECRGQIGNLYESRIRPMIPYGIRGVLWDQGESGTAIFGLDQYTLMGALIRGWRAEWGEGDFPFLYIEKPSGGGCAFDPSDPVTRQAEKCIPLPATPSGTGDGRYRETHIRIMQYPGAAMVTSSDLGAGVHPVNKSGYGERAARVALGTVYGRKVETCGPVFASVKIDGGKARVQFTHVGRGLVVRHAEKLQGFAVAGEDKVFYWADAAIDGPAVVVSCDRVTKPVAIRYGWGNTHPWANLFNQDGLPALPFRTDSW